MKKIFCLSVMIFVSLLCYSQAVLEVNFTSPKSGTVFLYNTKSLKTDTLLINDGFLVLSDALTEPTFYYMLVDGFNNSRPTNLVLSGEKTIIEFDSLKQSVNEKSIFDIYPNQPHFKKDPNRNEAFYAFQKSWMVFYDSIERLSTSDSEVSLEKRKAVYNSFLENCDSLIYENRNEFISATIIQYLLNENLLPLETIQTYYDYLGPSIKDSFMGLKIGEYAGKAGKVQPGQPAPDFELLDADGNKVSLSKLKGKNVLLHFWSSTCAPCIKEAPELLSLNNAYKDRITTLNISLDTDKDKWLKGIERAGIREMNNFCDLGGLRGKVAQDYFVNVIPAYYLIDEQGSILVKGSLSQISEEIKRIIH